MEGGAKTPLFLADSALKPFVLQIDLGGAIEQKAPVTPGLF